MSALEPEVTATMTPRTVHTFLILLGSNLSDAKAMIDNALAWLQTRFEVVEASPMLESCDSTGKTDLTYVNAVAEIRADISNEALNAELKAYEAARGRRHGVKEVAIDLDIVVADGRILRVKDYQSTHFQRCMQLLLSEDAD